MLLPKQHRWIGPPHQARCRDPGHERGPRPQVAEVPSHEEKGPRPQVAEVPSHKEEEPPPCPRFAPPLAKPPSCAPLLTNSSNKHQTLITYYRNAITKLPRLPSLTLGLGSRHIIDARKWYLRCRCISISNYRQSRYLNKKIGRYIDV